MATTTTSLTPAAELFAFTGLVNQLQEQSYIPRQEVVFKVLDTAVTAAVLTEDQEINISCLLPVNFAYALSGIFLCLSGADAADWDDVALALWTDGGTVGTPTRTLIAPIEGLSHGTSFNSTSSFGPLVKTYNFGPLPQLLILPSAQPQLVVKLGNTVIDGVAMKVNMTARMLMYDISQAHHYAVNTPVPTR